MTVIELEGGEKKGGQKKKKKITFLPQAVCL